MTTNDIEILIAGDDDHEELTAEIFYKGKFVALLSQDKGPDSLVLEFPDVSVDQTLISRSIDLGVFTRAIKLAQDRLISGKRAD